VDLRTFHSGGLAYGRRRARAVQAQVQATAAPRQSDVAALLTGSSMRVMEAGLAIVAIGTAVLLGLAR
jgi:hypothetical protein